jgi:hypothetical protein
LGPSITEITSTYTEKPIIYASLIGNPSTGKTPALRAVSTPCYEVERSLGISSDSKLANGATTESIIQMLSVTQRVLSHYDEGNIFFGSFGRYKQGGEALDRAVYLELYNGSKFYNRDTKGSRTRCIDAQLNIVILVHGYAFANVIREEITSLNDGLSHRFFIGAPPQNMEVLDMSLASTVCNRKPAVTLASLFYFLDRFCQTPVRFKLTKDGFERFDELHLFFKRTTFKANSKNEFFTA